MNKGWINIQRSGYPISLIRKTVLENAHNLPGSGAKIWLAPNGQPNWPKNGQQSQTSKTNAPGNIVFPRVVMSRRGVNGV